MNETKKKILDVSLELFSKKGYSAVSIRDICKVVQIKESSVYYHFKNKQAIFEELLMQFENIATGMMQQLEKSLAEPLTSEKGNFYEGTCEIFFEKYLMDDFCNKMMRLLLIEQFHNDEIRKLYDFWMFEKPLDFQRKVFSALADIGYIKNADSDYLAMKYYSPIYCFAQRWLFSGTLTEDRKEIFRVNAYRHINKFFKEI
ncbi:MAG: TetR/AcrR family transcriptional regulator [Suilimivivens sp.]